ncbi:antizyme inhibitor 1-like [Protopterus annectens]|uniref:antizyme inhibitor 1-like n=1 Tax=Protopterus annectens TaxID=7888 RepID=UPI001CFBAF11|nr:antizyme inhibitor 1-like [Protopterus annectens]
MKGFFDHEDYSIGLLEQGSSIREVIDNCICEQTLAEKNAFFVADLGNLMKKHNHWQKVMAQIKPFYTVKCNSHRPVLEILAAFGTNFVCASKNEMALVLNLGVAPENVLYASPCKQLSQIKYASKMGISLMTCDNETELKKIARNHPNAKLLLHIATEDVSEVGEMSMKFGATLKSCMHLLECSKELGVQVVGVKFHTSRSWKDPIAYGNALSDARCVFDMAEAHGFNMSILDIGDIFSETEFQLEKVYNIISPLLKRYFPEESGLNVIAEPGSYFVSSAFTLAVNVIAKKVVSRDQLTHAQGNIFIW